VVHAGDVRYAERENISSKTSAQMWFIGQQSEIEVTLSAESAVALYGCETWSPDLRKEHRLVVL
jgi:hypothetical protein